MRVLSIFLCAGINDSSFWDSTLTHRGFRVHSDFPDHLDQRKKCNHAMVLAYALTPGFVTENLVSHTMHGFRPSIGTMFV